MKSFVIKLTKFVLYIAFVSLAVVYTPRLMSKVLSTDHPIATITSGSMWPQLKTNDLIFMKGATADEVQVYDVIIFKSRNGFTIHRLIRKENGKLITKGDANNAEDPPIDESDVVGRIVYVGDVPMKIPFLGIIARSLSPKISKFMGGQ